MSARYVSSPSDLPPGEHHAILTFSTIHIPGDERSRTHPGHGYPASTETQISCAVYPTREEWLAEIQRKEAQPRYGGKDWVPTVIKVPSLTTEVKVKVDV